jgi:hypothetical protein
LSDLKVKYVLWKVQKTYFRGGSKCKAKIGLVCGKKYAITVPKQTCCLLLAQGCQMATFQKKIPNLGTFWRNGICCYIFWPFGIFYDRWVHFMGIWLFCSHLVYFSQYQEKSGNPVLVYLTGTKQAVYCLFI